MRIATTCDVGSDLMSLMVEDEGRDDIIGAEIGLITPSRVLSLASFSSLLSCFPSIHQIRTIPPKNYIATIEEIRLFLSLPCRNYSTDANYVRVPTNYPTQLTITRYCTVHYGIHDADVRERKHKIREMKKLCENN
jgi:hypothetical protein